MAASANPILADKGQRDPTLFCTGYKKPRFYLFTQSEPEYVVPMHSHYPLLTHVLAGITNPANVMSSMSARRVKNKPSPRLLSRSAPARPRLRTLLQSTQR
jgi:hypothetical protein